MGGRARRPSAAPRGRRAPAAATGLVVTLAGLLASAGPARAADAASARVSIHAQVLGRTALEIDRRVVTLVPGERVTLRVTVKCRLAAGDARRVHLDADLEPAVARLVTVSVEGRQSTLAAWAPVATLTRSGVATRRVVLSLAPAAAAPLTFGLRLRTSAAF